MEVQDKIITGKKKGRLNYSIKVPTDRAMKMLETRLNKLCREVDELLGRRNDQANVDDLYLHDC